MRAKTKYSKLIVGDEFWWCFLFVVFFQTVYSCNALNEKRLVYPGVYFNFSTPNIVRECSFSWINISQPHTYGILPPWSLIQAIKDMTRSKQCFHQLNPPIKVEYLFKPTRLIGHVQKRCGFSLNTTQLSRSSLSKQLITLLELIDELSRLIYKSVIARKRILLIHDKGTWRSLLEEYNRGRAFIVWPCFNKSMDIRKIYEILKPNFTFIQQMRSTSSTLNSQTQRNKRSASQNTKTFSTIRTMTISTQETMRLNMSEIMDQDIKQFKLELKTSNGTYQSINFTKVENSWIHFDIRRHILTLKPTEINVGNKEMKICGNSSRTDDTLSCLKLSISIRLLSPQKHQIHIRNKARFVYFYKLPLLWFRSFGVNKESDLRIVYLEAPIPVRIESSRSIRIFRLVSLMGTVINLKLRVLIKKRSTLSLTLQLPIMRHSFKERSSNQRAPNIIVQSNIICSKNESGGSKNESNFDLTSLFSNIEEELRVRMDDDGLQVLVLKFGQNKWYNTMAPRKNSTVKWALVTKNECISMKELTKTINAMTTNQICALKISPIKSTKTKPKKCVERLTTTVRPIKTTSSFPINNNRSPKQWRNKTIHAVVICGIPTAVHSPAVGELNHFVLEANPYFTLMENIQIEKATGYIHLIFPVENCPQAIVKISISDSSSQLKISIQLTLKIPANQIMSSIFYLNMSSYQLPNQIQSNCCLSTIKSINQSINLLENIIKSKCRMFSLTNKNVKRVNCNQILLVMVKIEKLGKIQKSLDILVHIPEFSSHKNCPYLIPAMLLLSLFPSSHLRSRYTQLDASIKLAFHRKLLYKPALLSLHYDTFQNPCLDTQLVVPPDLPVTLVYSNIPTRIRLTPILWFYQNLTTTEYVTVSLVRNEFLSWAMVDEINEDLLIFGRTAQARQRVYTLELRVDPSPNFNLIQPRVFVRVKSYLKHPLFNPYIRQLNHLISVDMIYTNLVTPVKSTSFQVPVTMTMRLIKTLDQTVISKTKMKHRENISDSLEKGNFIVFINSADSINSANWIPPDKFHISYKLSYLPILSATGTELRCPWKLIDSLNLRNRTTNSRTRDDPLFKANKRGNSGEFKIVGIHLVMMNSCVGRKKTFYNSISFNENNPTNRNSTGFTKDQSNNRRYWYLTNPDSAKDNLLENSDTDSKYHSAQYNRKLFLMVTVLPAVSFLILSLILGIFVACVMRNKKLKRLKIQQNMNMRGKTPLLTYSNKPLILQNELPPHLPPNDDFSSQIFLPNLHASPTPHSNFLNSSMD